MLTVDVFGPFDFPFPGIPPLHLKYNRAKGQDGDAWGPRMKQMRNDELALLNGSHGIYQSSQ